MGSQCYLPPAAEVNLHVYSDLGHRIKQLLSQAVKSLEMHNVFVRLCAVPS